ncbi:uncharacterized protein LOC116341324 [Contarinia nasturtii]|uniref:uncharacterized protein LOC116341324 n=1 Tax=Contarinia nasturtii TaxID=265458 RepID=UPI0012D3E8E2|nr:uncharacterized protein LOC116341324 [Contarinia nasturtii]
MLFFIQIIFAVTILTKGYQCAGCFGSEADDFFDVSSLFYPIPSYNIKAHNLESVFVGFKTSIVNVIKSLDGEKTETNAAHLLILLHSNLHEFSIWVSNILNMQNTITEFVNGTISEDKKFISDNLKILKKLKMNKITELGNIFQKHASAMIKHHNDINKNIGLLAREMTHRKIIVNMITDHITKNGILPESLKAIFDTVKPKLFQATTNMVEINQSMSECIALKNGIKPTVELNNFLKTALLSGTKSSKNLEIGSTSMKKNAIKM